MGQTSGLSTELLKETMAFCRQELFKVFNQSEAPNLSIDRHLVEITCMVLHDALQHIEREEDNG